MQMICEAVHCAVCILLICFAHASCLLSSTFWLIVLAGSTHVNKQHQRQQLIACVVWNASEAQAFVRVLPCVGIPGGGAVQVKCWNVQDVQSATGQISGCMFQEGPGEATAAGICAINVNTLRLTDFAQVLPLCTKAVALTCGHCSFHFGQRSEQKDLQSAKERSSLLLPCACTHAGKFAV